MNIHLVAVGEKMPQWARAGYDEYARRLPKHCALRLREIPAGYHGKRVDATRIRQEQSARLLAALPTTTHIVALDVAGCAWSTEQLAERLQAWLAAGRDLALIIGGPEGLAPQCLARSDEHWSLSNLTFPHALVRVVVAEQLFRAWSLLQHHPYHRGSTSR